MNIVAIIPARGGSKRFPRKNLHELYGKPLVGWAIQACGRSGYIGETYVSTEDPDIAVVAAAFGASCIERPKYLAEDEVPKMEVIRHADQWIHARRGVSPRILVSVQANSPEVSGSDIDKGIDLLIERNLLEVISVGVDHVQNAAFRVIRRSCLYNTYLSAHIGIVMSDCIDVHVPGDIRLLESRYGSREQFISAVTA